MAALKQKIQQDLTTALKEKKELELSVLRMLNAAIINKEKEKRYKISKVKTELGEENKSSLTPFANARVTEEELEKESGLLEDEVLEAISFEIKKRKDAALLFEKGKRMDLSEKEKEEAKILEKYLPEQLVKEDKSSLTPFAAARVSEEEIKKLAREIIEKNGAKEMKDVGKVMGELMPKIKGRADGSLVSKIIRELLAQ